MTPKEAMERAATEVEAFIGEFPDSATALRLAAQEVRSLGAEAATPTINEIGARHYAWSQAMGWSHASPLEALALVASEIGEAVNECRNGDPSPAFAFELADIVLRVMAIAQQRGINLEEAIAQKMEINFKRGNRGRTI